MKMKLLLLVLSVTVVIFFNGAQAQQAGGELQQ